MYKKVGKIKINYYLCTRKGIDMITVNDEILNNQLVKVGHFPDGTQCIEFPTSTCPNPKEISWYYDSDEELFTLASTVNWIRRIKGRNGSIKLNLPYVPNARMDRIKNPGENFSLKVFADFINSLNFNEVKVFNVHSNVSEAVINNIKVIDPSFDISNVIKKYQPDVIFFPDEGACKRYSDLDIIKNFPITFGIKKRDWKTGKILGLDVITDTDLTGKKVLIVDDICSAGGTFKFSAMKLKELGASDVVLYVSHCEDNIQNGDLLKTDLISKIYTTDSILHIEDPKIEVIHNFRNK
jgi:ribose-phosphate pyrophosphokinase